MSRHTLDLNDQQEAMLQELLKEFGFKQQEIFRFMLYEMYRKKKPPYNQPKGDGPSLEDRLTNEQYCTDMLGGVVEGDMCRITKPNGAEYSVPLKIIKQEKL